MCRFQWVEQDDTTAQEYLTMATQARDLGCAIDIAKLKELTKLGFISLPSQSQTTEVEAWTPGQDEQE